MQIKKLMQAKNWSKVLGLCVALAVLFCAGQALAQEGQQEGQPEGYSQDQKTDFSDNELQKFAKSYLQIQDIQQEYSDELSQMEDEQEAQELQEKYTQMMVDVVRQEGLSVEEYNQIGQAMNSSEEVRNKIEGMVEEMR